MVRGVGVRGGWEQVLMMKFYCSENMTKQTGAGSGLNFEIQTRLKEVWNNLIFF